MARSSWGEYSHSLQVAMKKAFLNWKAVYDRTGQAAHKSDKL